MTQNDLQTYDTNAEFWVEIIRNRRDKYREGLTNAAVILMLHPCFYNKHAERGQPENNIPAGSYFQTRPYCRTSRWTDSSRP